MLKKKFRIEIWTFSFQICFKNQFSTSGSGQTENTHIRVYAYFQFDHFPKSKIDFESRFEMRMYIFQFKIFFLERFGQYLKKSKNGFPIVFSNLARKGSGFFFQARKLIFLPNGLYLPTKQPWGYPKFWFWHHIFIYNYSYPLLRVNSLNSLKTTVGNLSGWVEKLSPNKSPNDAKTVFRCSDCHKPKT